MKAEMSRRRFTRTDPDVGGAVTRLAKTLAASLGLEIHRAADEPGRRRASLWSCLTTARRLGFCPRTVIDVGAARGTWSLETSGVWPDAAYLLVDPLVENGSSLAIAATSLKHATWRAVAVGAAEGTVTINVHRDLDGSSLYEERERSIVGETRDVAMVTVDSLVADAGAVPPFLLKADVQGAELEVIRGAAATLQDADMVILEVLLFDFFQGKAPQFADVMAEMVQRGFVPWDVFGLGYRPYDGALSQADVAFVKDDGVFRGAHQYATEEQRMAQLSDLQRREPLRAGHA